MLVGATLKGLLTLARVRQTVEPSPGRSVALPSIVTLDGPPIDPDQWSYLNPSLNPSLDCLLRAVVVRCTQRLVVLRVPK